MPIIANQGYRKDLNLSEGAEDSAVWNNLYQAGISNDIAILRNNLRNTSYRNLKTICANCQRVLQKEGVKWKQGDLLPDF